MPGGCYLGRQMTLRNLFIGTFVAVATVVGAGPAARADMVLRTDGSISEGKIISQDAGEVVLQADAGSAKTLEHIDRKAVSRIVLTDEHGAWMTEASGGGRAATQPTQRWTVPPEPAAPPVPTTPPTGGSYYVIPLQGEVGATVLASSLEKSLADAVKRKPSVVVLDINSPGGLVAEAEQMMKVLHRYNKQLRIVALMDQDLSAAAIFSLSVKEIYVKSSSTIGAATAFVPGRPDVSAKVEEKMQSAWRAVARNSAEEGGHDRLLAEAMIDNDRELHLESVDGKKVVKEGPGENTLCRKGKILTLTSHEAVECGLAVGIADDLNELGQALHLQGWTECPGLGRPLAEYLPQRAAAFKAESVKLASEFAQNLHRAVESDPAEQVSQIVVNRSIGPNPIGPPRMGPTIPGRLVHPSFPRHGRERRW